MRRTIRVVLQRLVLSLEFLLLVSLMACSGGGGGGSSTPAPTPTSTNIPFQLFPTGYFSNGYTETYQLSGSDNVGDTFTGTLTSTTQAQTTYASQAAIPVQSVITITNTQNQASFTDTGNEYYSTDPANLMYFGYTDAGDVFTYASLNVIPQTAMIGASGDYGTYTGSGTATGYNDTISWKLTNANNGLANVVVTDSTFFGSTLDSSTTFTYVIDQQGNRQRVTVAIYDVNSGVTITLTGN